MTTCLRFFSFFIILLSGINNFAHAQQEVLLWPEGAPGAMGDTPEDKPSLYIYQPPADSATGAAILICPGGGYSHLAMEKEGFAVARWFNSMGMTAFVLKYRLGMRGGEDHGYRHPIEINDAKRAMRLIRHDAKKYGIDENRIGVIGFSAGGHLASTLGTHYDNGMPNAKNAIDRTNTRPNFMILMYPVISMSSKSTHRGSRFYLLGPNPSKVLTDSLSNETQIDSMTPPTFLVHATDDQVVPVENSIDFYLALHENNVPAEMHIFEYGGHGFGLAPQDPTLNSWTDLCHDWLARMNLLSKP